MKIGILTYHRCQNYGGVLQAISLRHILSTKGHDVYFVDYWPEYHKQIYAVFSFRRLMHSRCRGSIRYLINTLKFYKLRKERASKIKAFICEQIEPYCVSYDSSMEYDVLIYGSDQIWRKQPMKPARFDPVYFGANSIKAKCHISYAASMGKVVLDSDDEEFLREHLSRFTKLSVREDQLKETLLRMGIDTSVVLDPTLLMDKEKWEKLINIPQQRKGKYVLYYKLLENSFDEKQISLMATRMGCELVVLDGMPKSKKKNHLSTCNPQEFLSLIKNAEVVYTSSYHGLVFSIIFEKTFYASFARNEERAKSLVSKLGLQTRLLEPNGALSEVVEIDYTNIRARILSLREVSLNFLRFEKSN